MFFGRGGFPFGGFDESDDTEEHEHEHNHGASSTEEPEEKDSYYKLLGVERNVTDNELKSAYKKAALVHHPDRGGDEEMFKKLRQAYEVLSDPAKRKVYDQYGAKGLNEENMDPMSRLFRQRERREEERKGENATYPLEVTLEDMYNGTTKQFVINRTIICKDCQGKGGKGDKVATCSECQGKGGRVLMRHLGMGMFQQMHVMCDACEGEGTKIAEEDKCPTCRAKKVVEDNKTVDIYIERGMQNGHKITFHGHASESPGVTPGDVVIQIQMKKHPKFRRDGAHLFMKHSILLSEALTGFNIFFRHLDDRSLVIKSTPDHVYVPGYVQAIKGEGMPIHRAFEKGHLFIEFDVIFPPSKSLPDHTCKLLRKMLPSTISEPEQSSNNKSQSSSSNDVDDDDVESSEAKKSTNNSADVEPEEVTMEDASREEFFASGKQKYRREAYDEHHDGEEEDEDGEGGPSVQCRQA